MTPPPEIDSLPPDFEEWNARAQAALLVLMLDRGELVEMLARAVQHEYESDARAGDERVPVELLARLAVEVGAYR